MKDEEIEKLIENSMKKIDNAQIETPELTYFTELVKSEKKSIVKKQNTQFIMFIFCSLFVVSAVLLCVFVNMTMYGVLQFAAIVLFLIIYFVRSKTEVARNDLSR